VWRAERGRLGRWKIAGRLERKVIARVPAFRRSCRAWTSSDASDVIS
jgi:hypothetical protein